jgi:tetratricopeptide (TPR) repeat protein
VIAERPFAIPASAFVLNEGTTELQRGNTGRALELFLEITRAEPDHPAGWSWAGRAFLILQQPRDAIACFDRVLALDPSFWPDLGLKGRALLSVGDAIDALPCFDGVLARDASVLDAYADRARCLAVLEKWKECLGALAQIQQRGQMLTPDLDQLQRDAKERLAAPTVAHAAAANSFMKVAELNERAAEAFDYQGDVASAQDRVRQAVAAYQRAAKEFEAAGRSSDARRATELAQRAAAITFDP